MALTLHIFNPETDFALAVGEGPYTPPGSVLSLKQKMALLPSLYADDNDFILVPEDFQITGNVSKDFIREVERKDLSVIKPSELPEHCSYISYILPWGWNHSLYRDLSSFGIPKSLLPSLEQIETIRNLSNRRTCIPFRKVIKDFLNLPELDLGEELTTIGMVKEYLSRNPYSYFKYPWSSSGRGVVSSTHISEKGLLEWAWGSIRRQGSIMAEKGWDRKLDFASEWICRDGKPIFLGLSVFNTSPRGKYGGNVKAGEEELSGIIKANAPEWNRGYLEAQKEALARLIAPHYSGPVGIDMLCDTNGKINPCVEINLRMTMGHVVIFSQNSLTYNSKCH